MRFWAYFPDETALTKPAAYAYPARLSNAQALLGLSQLRELNGNLSWRSRLSGRYRECFEPGSNAASVGAEPLLRYTFLVERREAWEELFRDVLEMCVWFTSIAHGRDRDLDKIGYAAGSCPVAEEAARHCVNLPTHPRIADPEPLLAGLRRGLQDQTGRYRLLQRRKATV